MCQTRYRLVVLCCVLWSSTPARCVFRPSRLPNFAATACLSPAICDVRGVDVHSHASSSVLCNMWAFVHGLLVNSQRLSSEAAVPTDRRCIATGNTTLMSVEEAAAYLGLFPKKCNGGQSGQACQWFKNTGGVTGGGKTWVPYSRALCARHATPRAPDVIELRVLHSDALSSHAGVVPQRLTMMASRRPALRTASSPWTESSRS